VNLLLVTDNIYPYKISEKQSKLEDLRFNIMCVPFDETNGCNSIHSSSGEDVSCHLNSDTKASPKYSGSDPDHEPV